MTGSGSSMFLDDARSLADVIATGTDEQQRMQFARRAAAPPGPDSSSAAVTPTGSCRAPEAAVRR